MKRLLFGALLLSVAACAAPPCRTHTALFFGMTIGEQGEVVSEADWQSFVAKEVTPRLDGFTVIDATGHYRSPTTGETVMEKSRILTVVHPDEAEIHRKIDAIAEAYKARFRQESVLRVDQCAAFAF
jgi:hypothetical protein